MPVNKKDGQLTASEVKSSYESNADTNAYTDSEKTKLAGVEDGAEVNDVSSVNSQTGAVVLDADSISDAATVNKFASAAELSKLAGIESGATADQTGAEIKSLYEAESNTNAFTDSEQSKLSGIESGAEVNDVNSVNGQTGTVSLDADDIDDTSTTHKFTTSSDITKLSNIEDNATANPNAFDKTTETLDDITAGTTNKHFTASDEGKLDGIESGATADQTGAEIKTLYEAEANTNAFTDAEQTKLSGIETGADVTDSTNVDAAGATMNTDTDVSTNSWVLDEDTMTSNSATKLATQQSIKAYVDTEVAGAGGGAIKSIEDEPLESTTSTSRVQIGTTTLDLATGKKYKIFFTALHNTNNTNESGKTSLLYLEFSGHSGGSPQYYSVYNNLGDNSTGLSGGVENTLDLVVVSQTPGNTAVASTEGVVFNSFTLDTTGLTGTMTVTPTQTVNAGTGTQQSYTRYYTVTAIEITG